MLKLAEAINFAKLAHDGQTRKYTGEPYFNHPFCVMLQAITYGCLDEDILCACVLHDIIEDTKYDKSYLNMRFGDRVACLVDELTNKDDEDKPRKERMVDRNNKYRLMSEDAAFVKILDRIDNLKDIEKSGDFAKIYWQETENMVDSFMQVDHKRFSLMWKARMELKKMCIENILKNFSNILTLESRIV
jgi:(p)ppGpp synthase/HD superfamily hydrolase